MREQTVMLRGVDADEQTRAGWLRYEFRL